MKITTPELPTIRFSAGTVRLGGVSPFLMAAAMALSAPVFAMSEMADEDLRDASGAGLTLPFENFRMQMAPTSFIELTGTAPGAGTTFLRGDVRYYGLTMSRGANSAGTIYNTDGRDSTGGTCIGGTYGLGCAQTLQGIENFSTVDNPYLLRVFEYTKYYPNNTLAPLTVLEFLGPSNTDTFRWSFWGEIEAGRTVDPSGARTGASCSNSAAVGSAATGNGCILQSQSIILGKPATYQKSYTRSGTAGNPMMGPELRLFQFQGDNSLGINYASRLSGDYRFSVNKAAAAQFGVLPDFTDEEGLYFRNVNAYLPLGQLHYQAITLNDTQSGTGGVTTNGNFVIELTAIPNQTNVYGDFYSLPDALPATTQCDAACQNLRRGYNRTIAAGNTRYYETHGYVSWGDKFPTCGFSNCMNGTGVSSVRYAGIDPDGATLVINATNFPAHSSCGYNQCTFSGETVGAKFAAPNTRDEILAAGGVSFRSSGTGSTWTVLNNQNLPQSNVPAVTRVRVEEYNCGFWGCGSGDFDFRGILERNPTYQDNSFNPLVTVNAINLGSARFEGLQINHMKITSLGANF